MGRCRYTAIPDPLIKDAGLSAAELTAWNMDKSAALDRLLEEAYKGRTDAFLGEMQFAYLAFLLGHSLRGSCSGSGWWRCCSGVTRPCGSTAGFCGGAGCGMRAVAFSFRKDRDEGLAAARWSGITSLRTTF